MNYIYIKTNDELYHHGIPGQKWGERNGPPYPLKPGAHSAAEKKHGGLLQKWHDRGVQKYLERAAEKKQKELAARQLVDIKDCDLKKKEQGASIAKDCAAVNPNYDPKAESRDYSMNCSNCVMTYALRRAGFDVEAQPLPNGRTLLDMDKIFDGCCDEKHSVKIYRNKKDTLADLKHKVESACNKLSGSDDTAVGFIAVHGSWSGHVFSWEKSNGKIVFLDAQSNHVEKYTDKFFNYVGAVYYNDLGIFRLDNCKVDVKAVNSVCKNR